jgi:uncharacterized protein YaiI (UPF0178 family)
VTASGPRILVDADACPVKDEIYRVAQRYGVAVRIVANAFIRVPPDPLFERVLVDSGFDAADDWIAGEATPGDVVVTSDILLADRCVKAGAKVLAPNGRFFDAGSIGQAVAGRALMEHLRATGDITGGPAPFAKADRSRFLSALDETIVRLRRMG